MSIASAFNDIAKAHGGSVKGKSITEAIDALNDVLAGSDQEAADTIEGAIRLLGQHIGGGGDIPEGYYFMHVDGDGTLDKTWSEINTMYDDRSEFIIIIPAAEGSNPELVNGLFNEKGVYAVGTSPIIDPEIPYLYTTDSANGYPTYTEQS